MSPPGTLSMIGRARQLDDAAFDRVHKREVAHHPVRGGSPIILVPSDILRALPIAKDWADISDAASHNAELRARVSDQIADLWRTKTLKDKEDLKRWALSGTSAFETVLEMLRGANPKPYDYGRRSVRRIGLEKDCRGNCSC